MARNCDEPSAAVVPSFSAEFKRNLVRNGHTFVGLLSVEYKEDYSTFQRIDEANCSESATIRETWEIVH